MAKTKLEAKTWLKEVGFEDAQVEELAAKFTAAQLEKIAEGYMRQSDYDRQMNDGKAEIEKAQADLAAANDRFNAELADWAKVQAEGKSVTTKMQADLEKAQADVFRLTQTFRRVATEHGIDAEAALKDVNVVTEPPKPPAAPQVDLTGYAKADQLGQIANLALTLPAELATLAQEHHDLTGKNLDQKALVAEIQKRATTRGNTKSLEPRQVWEEMHNIPTVRAEAEQKRFDAAIKDAEERGRQRAITESALPGGAVAPGSGKHAPIFGKRESVLGRPQPGSTVNAAVVALRQGKYRQGAKSA